jgi:RND superfamily putative drug exporter
MAGVLYRLGRLSANRAVVVVAVWLGVVVLVRLVVWGVGAETGNDLSLPGTESQQATDLLGSRFPPQQNGSSPIVFHVTKARSPTRPTSRRSSPRTRRWPRRRTSPRRRTRSPTPPRDW